MAESDKKDIVNSLLEGLERTVSAKTVVGAPTQVGDTIIIPLVDVSFGLAAGNGKDGKYDRTNGAGGLGGKLSPNAVLIIKDGTTRLLSIKNQDSITKILDMVPEVVHRLSKEKKGGLTDEDIQDLAFPEEQE